METAALAPDATSGEELQPVRELRRSIRAGTFAGSTAGQAGGFMQANLVILPEDQAVPTIREGELSLFWACGVTPQVALEAARLPFAITHCPGKMLVTDVPSTRLMAM